MSKILISDWILLRKKWLKDIYSTFNKKNLYL